MSRSNQTTENSSPIKKYISFEAGKSKGYFCYYDKEKEENIILALPVRFLVLDQKIGISGWHEPTLAFAYSNKIGVFETKKVKLEVKTHKSTGNIMEGFYNDILVDLRADKLKYTRYIYAIMMFDTKYELVEIAIKGAAFGGKKGSDGKYGGGWRNYEDNYDVLKGAISCKSILHGKKGDIEFKVPIFDNIKDVSEEAEKIAIIHDQQLQKYFLERDGEAVDEAKNETTNDSVNLPPEEDDLPF